MRVIARALAVVAVAAVVSTGCTSSAHETGAGRTTPAEGTKPVSPVRASTPAPAVSASAPACTAAQGTLVPTQPAIAQGDRLVQAFAYVNQGPPCYEEGFPVVQLYDAQHQLLNIPEVDGNIVLGTAVPARYLLQQDDPRPGFNIETPMSGSSCEIASYASASFGGGSTPTVAINFQVCGILYLTPIFE
jgi:hypothetical protein